MKKILKKTQKKNNALRRFAAKFVRLPKFNIGDEIFAYDFVVKTIRKGIVFKIDFDFDDNNQIRYFYRMSNYIYGFKKDIEDIHFSEVSFSEINVAKTLSELVRLIYNNKYSNEPKTMSTEEMLQGWNNKEI